MNKKSFFSNSGDLFLFRESAMMIVAAVVSLLLQVISFLTTLSGAKAYFEATAAIAPLFFALAVQSVVYFLENGIRRKVTLPKILALTLAIVCSSYFSFVGIYNNIVPPERYLEKTYKTYATALEEQLRELQYSRQSSASADINKAVNGIVTEYTSLSSEAENLNSLSEQIEAAKAEASLGLAAPRRYDYYYYEDYAAAYAAYIASLSQSGSAEQQAKIDSLLKKYGVSDSAELSSRTAQIKSRLSLIEGTLSADSETVYTRAETIRAALLNGTDAALAERIFALYRELSGDALRAPDMRADESVSLVLPEFGEISAGRSAAETRELLLSYIITACDTVNSCGGSADPDNFTFENVYTLPIYSVTKSFNTDAIVSLLLALLVDILSLLFAMIFVRQKSILSARDTKSAASMRGNLFEQNVVTALQLGACAEGSSFSSQWSGDEITERLARFVNCFHADDAASAQGFSMIADRNSLGDFEALVAFLCQFGLAKTVSSDESSLLTNGLISVPCVLLKTKFLLWVSEKFCTPDKLKEVPQG